MRSLTPLYQCCRSSFANDSAANGTNLPALRAVSVVSMPLAFDEPRPFAGVVVFASGDDRFELAVNSRGRVEEAMQLQLALAVALTATFAAIS
jgi:hypothetical protein